MIPLASIRRAAVLPAAALFCLTAVVAAPQEGTETALPAHPDRLVYPELDYRVPEAASYRATLSNGVTVFLAEDRTLPLVRLSVRLRAGEYLVPAGKEGLADMLGYLLRQGGTERLSPDELNQRLEFLAAQVSIRVGETETQATLDCLAKDVDEVLGLLVEMLRSPRFDGEKLEERRAQVLQDLERRNDRTASIEGREWAWLLRGREHFSARSATGASVRGLTRDDLVAFHRNWIHPRNVVLAVAGDFEREAMLTRLEKAFTGWGGEAPAVPPVPAPTHAPKPGVYVVEKDVNQGRVSIGHLGLRRDHPDYFAVRVMNDILGGGGFTSRITSRVRSDEGLAYSAGSVFGTGVHYPGIFRAYFQSKTRSCARAAMIVLEEIERIRTEPVSAEELATAKNSFIETLPRSFETPWAIVNTFADDHFTGRDPAFWSGYRKGYESVTAEAVLAAAKKHLHPERLVVLAVGDAAGLLEGDPEHPGYALAQFGPVTRMALPDPMTLERPAAAAPATGE